MGGRLNRLAYFWRALLASIVSSIAIAVLANLEGNSTLRDIAAIGPPVVALVTMVVILRWAVKRFHDLDRPGWHYLWFFVPLVNVYFGLLLIFARGTDGPNCFGPDPLGGEGTEETRARAAAGPPAPATWLALALAGGGAALAHLAPVLGLRYVYDDDVRQWVFRFGLPLKVIAAVLLGTYVGHLWARRRPSVRVRSLVAFGGFALGEVVVADYVWGAPWFERLLDLLLEALHRDWFLPVWDFVPVAIGLVAAAAIWVAAQKLVPETQQDLPTQPRDQP